MKYTEPSLKKWNNKHPIGSLLGQRDVKLKKLDNAVLNETYGHPNKNIQLFYK